MYSRPAMVIGLLAASACASPRAGDQAAPGGDSVATTESAGGVGGARADSTAPAPLRVRLTVPSRARRGSEVPVVAVLTNAGSSPRRLSVGYDVAPSAALHLDVVVAREDRTQVWRRDVLPPRGSVEPRPARVGTAHEAELAAGDSIVGRARWTQRDSAGGAVAAGKYLVRAIVHIDGRPVATDWSALEIVP